MAKITRRGFLTSAGVAGAVGLAGCGGDTQTGGSSGPETLKLGILLPETGDLGPLGKPMIDAGQLAVQFVNDADVPFEVDAQTEDTQTQQSAGISAANSLVNGGYPAVVGPASSGINIPVSKQVFIPNGIVGISPSSTALSVTSLEDEDYIFRTAPSDALQGRVLAQIASEDLEHQTASTMYVNNDYGQQLSSAFVGAFEERGGTIQNEVSFEKQQSSYSSRIQRAVTDDPDTVVVIGYPASGVQLFRDYYSGYDAERSMLVTDGLKDPKLPDQVGEPMDNVRGSSPLAAGPAKDAFTTAFTEEYDAEPGVFTSQTFDAAAVAMLAHAAAGEASGSAIRDEIRTVANPDGTEVTPENLAEGIELAADGETVQYVGASSSVDFDDAGDMTAVTYEHFTFGQDGIETVSEVSFGG
jgi:ABC-type branched-subunit amino acid transport system substrate-binding protein